MTCFPTTLFAIKRNDTCSFSSISAIVPVAAATMTPLPLLAALIVMKVRDCLVQKEKLPMQESDQEISIIKTKKMDNLDGMKMEESESKVKLVANGDANENCLA